MECFHVCCVKLGDCALKELIGSTKTLLAGAARGPLASGTAALNLGNADNISSRPKPKMLRDANKGTRDEFENGREAWLLQKVEYNRTGVTTHAAEVPISMLIICYTIQFGTAPRVKKSKEHMMLIICYT
ncbi:hypothetical protein ACJX0J_005866, partial [Zea mays]